MAQDGTRTWKWPRRIGVGLGSLLLLLLSLLFSIASGACSAVLPERFAVNAPIRHLLFGTGGEAPSAEEASRLHGPAGYGVAPWATGLPNVRFLRFGPSGELLASQPRRGRIVHLAPDRDGDGQSDGVTELISGLDRPHGLDLHDGWLYIAENARVVRVRYDSPTGTVRGTPEPIADLPPDGNHWTRTARIGPDGMLYVAAGSSCNVCEEEDERRAAMMRFPADGGPGEIYALGLRNSVGFDWQPGTNALFATDNGRDLLGDDFPPCELNEIVRGGFYGWPYVNGFGVTDPDFGGQAPEKESVARDPAHGFGAHNAPLGITFARTSGPFEGAALVALHGSWNRTRKDGYKVVSLHWSADGTIEARDFLTGFEVDEDVIGRPVDVAEGPDGSFYVSDDYGGVIYRVAPGASNRRHASAGATSRDPLSGLSAAEISERDRRGAALWSANGCAGCHDPARANAGVVVVPLEGVGARYDLESLVAFLAAPTPPMPPPAVDEEGRRDLAVHVLRRD